MQRLTLCIGLALAGLLMTVTMGCGNSYPGPNTLATSARVVIEWPQAPGRVMPAAAQSVRIALSDGNGYSASQLSSRPASGTTTSVTFTNLPVGTLDVTATAYPQPDGTGAPQAAGTSRVTTLAGQQISVTLTMASTIDHLEITSTGLSLSVGGTLQLTATPKDAAGNTVLVGAGNISWTSSAAAATVGAATGLVTGASAGAAIITATENDSQKSASVTVTITAVNSAPTASFTVTPASGTTATSFAFDASGSSDAQDAASALQVRWDWTNTGVWTTFTTTKTAAHTFAAPGTYTVALQVKDSGGLTAIATKTVVVSPVPVAITVSPTTATLSVGKTATFTATVTNTTNTAVTWSVVEAAGGSVTSGGVYTAPAAPGAYHVRATSVADGTKTATATVTVQAGDVVVIVN